MAQKAPGKAHRKGITLVGLLRLFPDDSAAERWFIQQRWGDEPWCPHCGSVNVREDHKHPTMSHRCREKECRKHFSVRTESVMARSKLGYQEWVIAIFLVTTSLKGVSSMKLHRDLGITQKSAWHLAHRFREAWTEAEAATFSGPIEADETFMGGKRRNMSNATRKLLANTGRGAVGKTAIVGVKDRSTKKVRAKVTSKLDAAALQGFVTEHAADGASVVHRRSDGLHGPPEPRDGAALSLRVRPGTGAHQRHGVVLVDAQARLHRHLPQDESEAPGQIRDRVRRPTELPRHRHHQPDGMRRQGVAREAVAVRRTHRARTGCHREHGEGS